MYSTPHLVVIHSPHPEVGPGGGGYHIYIYIDIMRHISYIEWMFSFGKILVLEVGFFFSNFNRKRIEKLIFLIKWGQDPAFLVRCGQIRWHTPECWI